MCSSGSTRTLVNCYFSALALLNITSVCLFSTKQAYASSSHQKVIYSCYGVTWWSVY